jgi:IMP dehydrogenase/GMP reductase
MKKYNDTKQLCFDDILMIPQHSDVESRKDVKLSMKLGTDIVLGFPVIASPMDTVCEIDMAVAIAKSGGLGIIHRFMPIEEQIKQVKLASKTVIVGAAVGAKGSYLHDAERLVDAGASVILIDTANGHSQYAIDAVKNLKRLFKDIHIMAGNVSTYEGFKALAKAGANSIRVGIGGGSVCTTRLVSGHGMPTLSSILDIIEMRNKSKYSNVAIIADGGIRTSGDMVKAFSAGADAVMLGSMLAGTDEAPGSLMIDATGKYKAFRGMASAEANSGKNVAVSEGISTKVKYKGRVNDVFKDIAGGLGSGCSYSGVNKLKYLYENAMFIEVSSNTNGENKPHANNL